MSASDGPKLHDNECIEIRFDLSDIRFNFLNDHDRCHWQVQAVLGRYAVDCQLPASRAGYPSRVFIRQKANASDLTAAVRLF